MTVSLRNLISFTLLWLILLCSSLQADDGHELWLKYNKIADTTKAALYKQAVHPFYISGSNPNVNIIRQELVKAFNGFFAKDIARASDPTCARLIVTKPGDVNILPSVVTQKLDMCTSEGFIIISTTIRDSDKIFICSKTDIGLLYGTFHFIRLLQIGKSLESLNIIQNPKIQYRLLNHWNNLDGSVERGYAGQSLWKWDELPEKLDPRYTEYARANASIGINGTVLNNVNADPSILTTPYLKKVAALADVFRPFGIKVFLSINFSTPISDTFKNKTNDKSDDEHLTTSDPLNPQVRQWWKEKADEIYSIIPDFGGFLVKANSEGMPGPQDYDRTHAQGANMLAEALAPFGGVVMWRAFVYRADVDPDRAKRAYKEFVPLDGKFHNNVFVQIKNGPIDFQPREPVHPLFAAMPRTPLMLELQITQEYLGHSTHLVYLAPQWKEYLQFDTYAKGKDSPLSAVIDGSVYERKMTGIAGVSNIGDDRNWCGHFFAQANWYAFGRLAWDHQLNADKIADEWVRMSLSQDNAVVSTVKKIMLNSWEACVNYMTPLGLHHIMQEGFHYGPQPGLSQSARKDWTSVYYHRADSTGLGFDRSSSGSNAVAQYPSPLRERFNSLETCPEKYLLWFHHVNWDYHLSTGRTLWEELCWRYHSGVDYVDGMLRTWMSLKNHIDKEIYQHVYEKVLQQQKDARIWRDTCLNYFQKFSRKEIITH